MLLPVDLPDIATLDPTTLALAIIADTLLRFGVAPALLSSAGAGFCLDACHQPPRTGTPNR